MQERDKSADSAGWRLTTLYVSPRFKSWPTSSASSNLKNSLDYITSFVIGVIGWKRYIDYMEA